MKMHKKMDTKILTRPEWQILLLFVIGIAGGTIYGNLVGKEMLFAGLSLSFMFPIDKKILFHTVFGQRMAETAILWLAGITEISVVFVLLLVMGYGFLSGLLLTVCVLQKGIFGILLFWGMMLPQHLIYVPVWYQMSLWGYQQNHHSRWLGITSAVLMIFVGSLTESCLNPIVLGFFIRIIP